VQLHVKAVLQAQRLELVLGDFTAEAPLDLPRKLDDPFIDNALVELVVLVHGSSSDS
jgi:hypothetical protein